MSPSPDRQKYFLVDVICRVMIAQNAQSGILDGFSVIVNQFLKCVVQQDRYLTKTTSMCSNKTAACNIYIITEAEMKILFTRIFFFMKIASNIVYHEPVTSRREFTRHIRTVPRRLEHLGNRHTLIVQIPPITLTAVIPHHMPNPGLMLIQPRYKRSTSRAAPGAFIKSFRPEARRRRAVVEESDKTASRCTSGVHLIIQLFLFLQPRKTQIYFQVPGNPN